MIYSLSDCEWKVKGYYPWVPLKDKSMETGQELMGITDWIDAKVPGGVHYDLYKAGLIPHPYKDMDSLKCEWVENRWWLYKTVVKKECIKGSYQSLVFKGIDYHAVIFVNGKERCRHEGMYEPIVLDITEETAQDRDLEIKIILMHVPDEMGQIGFTSRTYTQKSRFNYKWDFGTRLVNLGIWEECYIRVEEEATWENPYIYTDYQNGKGYVNFSADVKRRVHDGSAYEAVVTLEKGETKLQQTVPVTANRAAGTFVVENPTLWYPNGYGEQELYRVGLELKKDGRTLDRYETEMGIRSIDYRINEGSPEGALPYTFCINDIPIYIRGVNVSPFEHIYGNVTEEHYEHIIRLIKNMNVNMIRVNGVGIIEKDVFYRLCDKYGILIWQDFIQSSSGIDNVPSKRPEFLHLIKKTAESALLARRSYTSLLVWSGGNELMDENNVPAKYDDENIAMLKKTVEMLDPQRLFLPTTASGPNEFISREKGVSHDVHGHWQYLGNPEHYELYSQSDSLFHSEFGAEGMCSARSLDRFISKEYQTLEPMEKNMMYRHHGEWWCTYNRDRKVFGERKDVVQAIKCSQWLQAEGLRFILEANRRRKFHNTGSVIWQFNEPWPNVSGTSLVDYYLEPKMAYYWCKKAFADLAVSLDYRKLDYKPGEIFHGSVYLAKERRDENMEYVLKCEAMDMGGSVLYSTEYKGTADVQKTEKVFDLSFELPGDMDKMFAVRLSVQMEEQTEENVYFFCCGSGEPYAKALEFAKGDLEVSVLEKECGKMKFRLSNRGNSPILHVYPYCEEDFNLMCSDSYLTLFAGESREICVEYAPKFESGLLNNELTRQAEEPEIRFDYFNC